MGKRPSVLHLPMKAENGMLSTVNAVCGRTPYTRDMASSQEWERATGRFIKWPFRRVCKVCRGDRRRRIVV